MWVNINLVPLIKRQSQLHLAKRYQPLIMKKLIPVADLKDDLEFYKGAKFRLYGVGMSRASEEEDYYDYMLIYDHDKHMILANVTSDLGKHKAGSVICHVQLHDAEGRIVVSAAEIKRMFGTEKTFHILEE